MRVTLSGWHGLLEEAAEDERLGRDLVYEQLLPVLAEYVDVSAFVLHLVDLLEGRLEPEQLNESSQIPANTDIIGVLATRIGVLDHAVDQLQPVREKIARIIALTEASLVR